MQLITSNSIPSDSLLTKKILEANRGATKLKDNDDIS